MFSAAALLLLVGFISRTGNLGIKPIDPNLNTKENTSLESAFNKCCAHVAVVGNGGASGDSDIDDTDDGTSGYVCQLFNSQELTTDEAIYTQGGEGIANMNLDSYDASHPMLEGLYYRLYVSIIHCNQHLVNFGDYNTTMSAEVRFIRALDYCYLLNGWDNVPSTTAIPSVKPARIQHASLYKWLIDELENEVESKLDDASPKTSATTGYGRVNKVAAWMFLAHPYTNTEVYTGTADWANAKLYAKKVINSPHKLYTTKKGQQSAYQRLFVGGNGENGASVEAIFLIPQNGSKTTSYGVTLYLMAGSNDNSEHIKSAAIADNSTTGGWTSNRMRPDLVLKFFPNNDVPSVAAYAMPVATDDNRALFDGKGRNISNGDGEKGIKVFTNGFFVCKFSSFKTNGSAGHNSLFPGTDFLLMCAVEAYLMYVEANARQNNETTVAQGTACINAFRACANATTQTVYSLHQICDKWSREFYFEGLRRTTLIRFGYLGGSVNYNWGWRGGVKSGRNLDFHLNLLPTPTNGMIANSNLIQSTEH